MKAIFSLFVMLVICLAMVQAGVHHYTIKNTGGGDDQKSGTIFDTAASFLNGII